MSYRGHNDENGRNRADTRRALNRKPGSRLSAPAGKSQLSGGEAFSPSHREGPSLSAASDTRVLRSALLHNRVVDFIVLALKPCFPYAVNAVVHRQQAVATKDDSNSYQDQQ